MPGSLPSTLRHSGAVPSDLVAVQGIDGLGHLGVQFAKKFGYRVAAVGRGAGNAALAKAAEGYARMMSGKAEFRVVLTM